ncbi:ferredoxin-dependent glutamate synthase 1 [Quercus suber]|uniref:Ferredoxin-dependent glutamate synthase 1 n=1 Tax=Quercus suber TaxID=58331 RepID=A0AAW0KH37_QUESU
MALQSVSPIPHLLHSSSPKPSILASSNNGRYFIDFVGLHCKSKRSRRKFSATSRTFSHFVSSSKVKAVLDLARNNSASEESDSRSDLRPKCRALRWTATHVAKAEDLNLKWKV